MFVTRYIADFWLQNYTKKMTYANLYAILFGFFVIWFSLQFSFSSVCSLVLDYFAGDAFVAGDIDHIDAKRLILLDSSLLLPLLVV